MMLRTGKALPSFQIAFFLPFPGTRQNYNGGTSSRGISFYYGNLISNCHKLRALSSGNPSSLKNSAVSVSNASQSSQPELLGKPTVIAPKKANDDETKKEDDETKKEDDDPENRATESYMDVFSSFSNLEEDEFHQEEQEVGVEFYDPKVGDWVLGVVVSGDANRIQVNIGSDVLATMLTKELLPLHGDDMKRMLCQLPTEKKEPFAPGTIGIVKDEEALSPGPPPGRPVVDLGTVLCAEVLGRTMGGKPLLSSRRVTRRIAWQRVRQIQQLKEPINIYISEWNTGGLVTRIEGLRAFLPKTELVNKPYDNFAALKINVGRQINVLIIRVDEENGELIISEREAWDMKYLHEGTLLEGSIRRIFSYGAEVRVDGTSISGLLHISQISRARVPSVKELFSEGEKVKVMVVHSMFTNRISFSTAGLECEEGLILFNKQRVFDEAEQMAAAYRQKLNPLRGMNRRESFLDDVDMFRDGAECYANWSCLEFEPERE